MTDIDDVGELPLVSQSSWDLAGLAPTEGLRPLQVLAAKIESVMLKREKSARSQAIDDFTALVNRWAADEEVLAIEATNDENRMFYKRCASRHRELAKFVEALKGST